MLTFTSYDGIVPAAAGGEVVLALVGRTDRAWFQLSVTSDVGAADYYVRIFIKMQISGWVTLSPAYLGMADFTGT